MNTLPKWCSRIATVLLLACTAPSLGAQEITWVETRFHRVHLQNGNFIDGHVLRVTDSDVLLRLPVGEMSIRKDTVDRIELMKLRSIFEKPKLDPPLKKAAAAKAGEPAPRVKSDGSFPTAPASPELIENVARLQARLKIAKPDQKADLVDQMARLNEAGAYLASLLPTVEEGMADMIRSALMRSKDPESGPYLVGALESDKPFVRIHALTLLGILGNGEHARSIQPFLNDPIPAVRATAIQALQQLSDAPSIAAIADLVGESDDMVRLAAINAALELGRIHDKMDLVAEAIRRYLNGSEGRPAKELLSAVGRGRMAGLWQSVTAFLNDADPILRKSAALTLQIIAAPESTDAVVIRLDLEDDPRILIELTKAASVLKASAAIPSLIRLLRNGDDHVVQSSAAALAQLTHQEFGTREDKWTEWWERNSKK